MEGKNRVTFKEYCYLICGKSRIFPSVCFSKKKLRVGMNYKVENRIRTNKVEVQIDNQLNYYGF